MLKIKKSDRLTGRLLGWKARRVQFRKANEQPSLLLFSPVHSTVAVVRVSGGEKGAHLLAERGDLHRLEQGASRFRICSSSSVPINGTSTATRIWVS